MSILDLDEVDQLPFSLWLRWYQHELKEPFSDRRSDTLAFLSASVFSAIIHAQITPTFEMFNLSAPLIPTDSDGDPDGYDDEAAEREFRAFDRQMLKAGHGR